MTCDGAHGGLAMVCAHLHLGSDYNFQFSLTCWRRDLFFPPSSCDDEVRNVTQRDSKSWLYFEKLEVQGPHSRRTLSYPIPLSYTMLVLASALIVCGCSKAAFAARKVLHPICFGFAKMIRPILLYSAVWGRWHVLMLPQ